MHNYYSYKLNRHYDSLLIINLTVDKVTANLCYILMDGLKQFIFPDMVPILQIMFLC